jgi:hypothetical protein
MKSLTLLLLTALPLISCKKKDTTVCGVCHVEYSKDSSGFLQMFTVDTSFCAGSDDQMRAMIEAGAYVDTVGKDREWNGALCNWK